jgi:formyl-CoA transferase/succinyl-CoA--D-citramalate CoA-transferase
MSESAAGARPALAGVRVLELGHLIAGPFCGHLFADHGADVIKVEPPGSGDALRHWGGSYKGVGLHWPLLGRGKRSVTIDLRTPDGQAVLRDLARHADVLIENFRPGTLESWGLGPPDLHAANPRLIIVRISGFGQTGPYRDRAGFGSVGEAMGGLRHITGEPGRPPVRVGVSLGDSLAGAHAFIGALLALRARDRAGVNAADGAPDGPGPGQVVDIALYESVFAHMESIVAEFEKLGVVRQASGPALPGIAPSNVYPTIDDDWVVIGANQDAVFARLAGLMGRDDWAVPGSRFSSHAARSTLAEELDAEIATWTRGHTADELLVMLEKASVPAGRIYTAADIAADPHFAQREMIVRIPEPSLDGEAVPLQGVVPKLSVTPGTVRSGAPLLGADTDEVLRTVRTVDELARLRANAVV